MEDMLLSGNYRHHNNYPDNFNFEGIQILIIIIILTINCWAANVRIFMAVYFELLITHKMGEK